MDPPIQGKKKYEMEKKTASEKRLRTKMVSVRVLPHEEAELKDRASQAGYSIGAFLRVAILEKAGPRAQRRPVPGRLNYVRLLGELSKIGSNVNQLARRANTVGDLPAADHLREIRATLEETRDAIIFALRR